MGEKIRVFTGHTWENGSPNGPRAVCVTKNVAAVGGILHTNTAGLKYLGWYELANVPAEWAAAVAKAKESPNTAVIIE